jgi:hypothetical protein
MPPKPELIETPNGRQYGYELDVNRLMPWTPTPQQIRDVVLNWQIVGSAVGPDQLHGMPDFVREFIPTQQDVDIIGDAGATRETVTAPEKLQRARRRSGKPPIPPYERVPTEAYVTAIMARGAPKLRGEGMGSHASPEPHLRRGHIRTYATGRTSLIADTLVNFSEEAKAAFRRGSFFPNRSHYAAKP